MNKNILQSIKEEKLLESIKVVEIYLFVLNPIIIKYEIKQIITNEINNDIIYKNIIYENNYIFKKFINGYFEFIDKRESNILLHSDKTITNYGNDEIKAIYLDIFKKVINYRFSQIHNILTHCYRTEFSPFYIDILHKYESGYDISDEEKDLYQNFKNQVKDINYGMSLTLIESILSTLKDGGIKITIHNLSDKINNFKYK